MGRFFRTRAFIAMCIIAALLLGMSLYSIASRDKVSLFESVFGAVFVPIQRASNRLVSAAGNFKAVFTEYDALKEENASLKEQLADVSAKLRDAERDSVENKHMREILGIAEEREDLTFTMAHITAKEQTGYSRTVTLDRGSFSGIHPKDMVMTADGIVGYVSEVGVSWCKVVTILDASCEIGVTLTRTQQSGVLQGEILLAEQGLCKISYIKNDVTLAVGDSAETSGVGGIFPKGLFVGRVKEIKSEASGLAQYAVIEPAADIMSVETVFVVTQFEGKEK